MSLNIFHQKRKKAKWGARRQKKGKPGVTISSFEGFLIFFFPDLESNLVETALKFNLGHAWEVETLKAISGPCIELKAHGQKGQRTL